MIPSLTYDRVVTSSEDEAARSRPGWLGSVEAGLEHALRLLIDAYTRDLTGRRRPAVDEAALPSERAASVAATVRWFSAGEPGE
jgi:hypothetical protein